MHTAMKYYDTAPSLENYMKAQELEASRDSGLAEGNHCVFQV